MKSFRGIVRNNVVVLEGEAQLPEGAAVVVRLLPAAKDRDEAFRRMLSNPITRPIGMEEVIEADKREREQRWLWEDDSGQ